MIVIIPLFFSANVYLAVMHIGIRLPRPHPSWMVMIGQVERISNVVVCLGDGYKQHDDIPTRLASV